jgi:hypothetical protein
MLPVCNQLWAHVDDFYIVKPSFDQTCHGVHTLTQTRGNDLGRRFNPKCLAKYIESFQQISDLDHQSLHLAFQPN